MPRVRVLARAGHTRGDPMAWHGYPLRLGAWLGKQPFRLCQATLHVSLP